MLLTQTQRKVLRHLWRHKTYLVRNGRRYIYGNKNVWVMATTHESLALDGYIRSKIVHGQYEWFITTKGLDALRRRR